MLRRDSGSSGFSLVELLLVLAVMSLITAMSVPVLSAIRDSQNLTAATSSVSSALMRARAYAMAHNTYVWVGFYEEAANTIAPTNVFPYSGAGQVVIGMVASTDGTPIYANSATPAALPASQLVQVERLLKLENVHITDVGAPAGAGTPLQTRPNGAYSGTTLQYGINSDDTAEKTSYPFSLGSYTFYKTIRFSPAGEASIVINGDMSLRRVSEIGLRPTHGTQIESTTPNVVAIQFSGIEGAIETYRN